jgi:hypothetical protein
MLVASFVAVLAAIAAVVAILVAAYKNSKIMRDAIGDLVSAVGGALVSAFNVVKDAFKEVMKNFEGASSFFKLLGDILGLTIIPLLQFGLVGAIGIVGDVFAGLIRIIGGAINLVANIFSGIINIVKGFFYLITGEPGKAKDAFVSAFTGIFNALKTIFKGAAQIFLAPIRFAYNFIADIWNNTFGKMKLPSWLGGYHVPLIPKWNGMGDEPKQDKYLDYKSMATGGTVLPRAGGTLLRVAEAGKPERIEPLDKNGLSKRDRAIIAQLSGGGNATINVYPSAGMDEVELAALVNRQISFQLRKGAA